MTFLTTPYPPSCVRYDVMTLLLLIYISTAVIKVNRVLTTHLFAACICRHSTPYSVEVEVDVALLLGWSCDNLFGK